MGSDDVIREIEERVEEDFEEGGIADVLVAGEDRHEYTKRQKYSLFLGIILFAAILLIPVPSTFLESAVKSAKLSDEVLAVAEGKGLVTLKDGKISEIHDLQGLLSLIEEKDSKAHGAILKKAKDMKSVLALTVLMAVWWIGEAIPLPATALLPLVVLPMLEVSKLKEVAPSYASKVIFLFMGGFLIAAAMMKWGLHRRLALMIINAIGTSPRKVILGFMVSTAFLSMWISNTATTMMMMPIGLSIILHVAMAGEEMKRRGELKNVDFRAGHFRFGTALMLGIAYAASIGGVATIIGTPPNAVFVGTFSKLFPNAPDITFTDWLAIGVPISWTFLFIAWFVLVYLLSPPEISEIPGGKELVRRELEKLGPWSRGEKIVLAVFLLTALAWINSKPKVIGGVTIPGISSYLPFVNDYVIAMLAAILLFVIPVDFRRGEFALDWDHAKDIPWGILLLFGGGIALSSAFTKSGLANWIAEQLLFLKGVHPLVVMFAIVTLVIFLTEMTSNTAIATLMMPIMAGFALAMGEDPRFFMIPAAIAASFAFMLPVATPPNAIVFGTGYVTIPQMSRTGLVLNLIGIVFVSLLSYFLVQAVFGVVPGVAPKWVP
ncbi:anion transporter [Geoglobus ahangari]|uniref:Anion transporter n=1 Tax=Geoglobus ahangari TaxID=113653 RepID=A0A0F7IFV2_9EURY|nr:DASS family sodium-coupled anion symporter [Geoglobus ahangari]AKG91393.1 anion transporter [Geoglobus ahangari]